MTRLTISCILILLLGCGGSDHHINIQIVRHSSEILKCDKIFAENLEGIEERNEILLQTGAIDTTDQHPPIKSAIVTIDKNEIALTLIAADTLNAETTERYQGNGFNLTLIYQSTIGQPDKSIYIGNFLIENNESKEKFDVEGKKCLL